MAAASFAAVSPFARPPSLPLGAIKSSPVPLSSVSAVRRLLPPSGSCSRRAPLSSPSPPSSVPPPPPLRTSSLLGDTSIRFAVLPPTPSAAPLRPSTAGAPSPSATRTAPSPSSAPVRRRRRSGLPPGSAPPPSASPHRRRPRPRLRFARRPSERRRHRHPEPRRRLPPLRPPFPPPSLSRGEPWTVPFVSPFPPLSRVPLRRAVGRRRRPSGRGCAPLPSAAPARPPSGAPSRLPSGPGRQPPAPAGAADARDPRRRPPPAACARSTVDRAADAWAPPPVDPVRAPAPRLTQ
uniref:HGWP repeat containing protein-like n=1 Tax=Oryza sativa subsp. japonica TaxID=39947 RepID=Q5Z642_ORYSJ|nr:HGWP repeat containing protein-like [Oryza sativa Japonica Group]